MATGSIIFLSLFAVIIIALIAVAVYGSFKDKKQKQEELNKIRKIEKVASIGHVKAYLILDSLVSYMQEQVYKFNNETSTVSLSSINEKAKQTVQHLIDSREIQKLYESEERRLEFEPVLKELLKTKSTSWEKEAFFALSLIKNKAEIYKNSPQFREEADKASKIKWN